ncbi:MAG: hypothetical protein RLZZ217_1712 [Planctomycetota bacterium]
MTALIGSISTLLVLTLLTGAVLRGSWAFALVAIMFPLEQLLQSSNPLFIQIPWLFNLLVGLACSACLIMKPARGRGYGAAFNPAVVIACLLIALAFTSLLWSPQSESVADIIRSSLPPFILAVVIVPLLLDGLDDFEESLKVMLVAGPIIAAGVLFNPNSKNVWGRLILDLGAFKSSPLALSEMGGAMVIVAVLFSWKSSFGLAVRITAALLGAALFFASSSRGQVIFSGVVSVAFYPMAYRLANVGSFFLNATLLGVLGSVAVLGAQLFAQTGSDRRWSLAGRDALERLRMVTDFLGTWASQPAAWLLGFGNGAFYALGLGDVYVHNTYVEALAELGMVGFTLLALVTWFGVRGAWRLFSAWRDSPRDRNLSAVLLALLAYQILLSFKQGSFMGEKHLLMLFVVATRLSLLDQPAPEALASDEDDAEVGSTRTALG